MIRGSSEYLCSEGGIFCNHSIDELILFEKINVRMDVILSQIIKINIITLDSEIILPIDDNLFHLK